MDFLDTGRIRVEPKEGICLHFSLYAEGELPEVDIFLVRTYIDQFEGKVSFLVTRDSEYWLSAGAQKILFKDAASRVKAVAYVDRSPADKILSKHADTTYLRGVDVCSFNTMEEALKWLSRYGPLPPLRSSICKLISEERPR